MKYVVAYTATVAGIPFPGHEHFAKEADAKARATELAKIPGVLRIAIYEQLWLVNTTSDVQFIMPGVAKELSK